LARQREFLVFLGLNTDHVFLYWEWLLFENCPVTPAGNIRKPSEALFGLCLKNAVVKMCEQNKLCPVGGRW
jgi:hypothetical protein